MIGRISAIKITVLRLKATFSISKTSSATKSERCARMCAWMILSITSTIKITKWLFLTGRTQPKRGGAI